MLRVAAFTGNGTVPSARFRARQYIPALRALGVDMTEMPCRFGKYPPVSRWRRPIWGCSTLLAQIPQVLRSRSYDCVLLQREMISTMVTLEPLTRRPRVLDVDDAIFLFRGGSVARRLAKLSDHILCGNSFLAETFRAWNSQVTVLPTAVDTDVCKPGSRAGARGDAVVVGWVGTSSNLQQLLQIEAALALVLAACPNATLRVICDQPPAFSQLPQEQVQYVRWSEANELSNLQGMDIGIMPLADSLWARGKCSFKMLQYMACGIPAVVSPVGMNAEVLAMGSFAFAATTPSDWADALTALIRNPDERGRMGQEARAAAEQHFSVRVLAPRLAACLRGESAHHSAALKEADAERL